MSPAPESSSTRGVPPAFLARAVLALRRGLQRAADAVVPPQLVLYDHISGLARTHAVRAFVRLGIADLVAAGPLSASELAARTGADPDALARLLRALAGQRLLRRDDAGRFHATRLSDALRQGHTSSFAGFAEYFGSASNAAAWADFEATVRTGKNAFERVHGVSVWDWFDQHAGEREAFAAAMAALTELEAPRLAALYPFAEVTHLCDLGGGRGTLLAAILARHPDLRATLVDAEGVLALARPFLAERGVLERVALVAGSFFGDVPAGADAYLLKNVLHDWDDERCRAILGRCRAAMRPGQRLLLIEEIVESDATTAPGAMVDLHMMTVCREGRERGRAELQGLLTATGFSPRRVFGAGPGSSVLEGVAA